MAAAAAAAAAAAGVPLRPEASLATTWPRWPRTAPQRRPRRQRQIARPPPLLLLPVRGLSTQIQGSPPLNRRHRRSPLPHPLPSRPRRLNRSQRAKVRFRKRKVFTVYTRYFFHVRQRRPLQQPFQVPEHGERRRRK